MRLKVLALFVIAVATACGVSPEPLDGGTLTPPKPVVLDAGTEIEREDAGVSPPDGGTDAGAPDAGPVIAEHEPCVVDGATQGPCAAGLTCVVDANPPDFGVCKRTCTRNSECGAGQTCKLDTFSDGSGACGVWADVGEACDGFFFGPRSCMTSANDSYFPACVEGTCQHVCALAGVNGEAPCLPGMVCDRDVGRTSTDLPGETVFACGQCVPSCSGKQCGPDGCGGTCGTCPSGTACDGVGASASCTPQLRRSSVCGSDGCGGTCGTCPSGSACDGAGQCVCTPNCNGRVCGSDGCGGTCGACPSGTACDGSGQCVCAPNCSGRECGPDGCGGTCGSCPSGTACGAAGECACVPQCAGKQCGSDGCGGSCGSCAQGELCNASGQCAACTPSCNGRQCGSDGCGGTCGSCGVGQSCSGGQCINVPCSPSAQTGCSSGQRCVWSGSAAVCTSVGPGTRGASCFSENCGAGLGCDATTDICRRYCSRDSDCGFGSRCALELSGTSSVKMCTEACDPTFSPSGCPSGLGCTVVATGLVSEATDCRDMGTGTSGASCSQPDDCFSGYTCAGGSCRKLCELNSSCSTGACQRVTGWNTWGVCPR